MPIISLPFLQSSRECEGRAAISLPSPVSIQGNSKPLILQQNMLVEWVTLLAFDRKDILFGTFPSEVGVRDGQSKMHDAHARPVPWRFLLFTCFDFNLEF